MEEKLIITVPEKVSWNDERVLTTAQLAEFYGTSTDNIWQNFKRNRDRFVEGKYFFKLEGDALQSFRKNFPEALDKFSPVLYLWTKRALHLPILVRRRLKE